MHYAMDLTILFIILSSTINSECSIQFKDDEKTDIGLYFEMLDTIKFSKDTYKLAIYIDISNYEKKFHEIRIQNQLICNNSKINVSTTCVTYDSIIKHNLMEINKHYNNLKHLKDKKQKRALLNIIGKFNRFMYGNLNEDDLAEITNKINNNTINMEKTVKIQKKQTIILQSGLNNIKNITEIIQ